MISDKYFMLTIIFFFLLTLTLNFYSLINFLIYSEIIWLTLYTLFVVSGSELNIGLLSIITNFIIIFASIELSFIIYYLTKYNNININNTKNSTNLLFKKFNNTYNKYYIMKNFYWIYN
jgi:hypothetical protein